MRGLLNAFLRIVWSTTAGSDGERGDSAGWWVSWSCVPAHLPGDCTGKLSPSIRTRWSYPQI